MVVAETAGFALVSVERNFYASGAVSVTLTPVAGTATAGTDFASEPITVSWADGDSTPISVGIPIHNDTQGENLEAFTVELSNPTGGALLGPQSTATISIAGNAQSNATGGGGGWFGYVSLLMLGMARLVRSVWLAARSAVRVS